MEPMRLYPPAWGVGRESLEDFELGGYRIPAGAQVFMACQGGRKAPPPPGKKRSYDEGCTARPRAPRVRV
jgi:hypothetical protein